MCEKCTRSWPRNLRWHGKLLNRWADSYRWPRLFAIEKDSLVDKRRQSKMGYKPKWVGDFKYR